MTFRLAAKFDRSAARRAFSQTGHVHLPCLIDQCAAERLWRGLRDAERSLVFNHGSEVTELSPAAVAALTSSQRATLDQAIVAASRTGFQFRFETVRLGQGTGPEELERFATWLTQETFLNFVRDVTSLSHIVALDAQGTAYGPGDFLTGHDDAISGENRVAAYVIGLTPTWRLEWGGALLFHGADGHIAAGYVPTFNTVTLFSVPRMHSVSEVTDAAAYRRYSITGWLKAFP